MVKIIFMECDGTRHDVYVTPGWSLMEGAVHNGVPGIVGACGGACACATCQVYLPDASRALTGERSADEASMLEYAVGVRVSSRLACQICVTEEMNGMIVQLPTAEP